MDKRLKHLNALHCFEAAARNQSYSRAAEELFITQAAVSQQMRLLEKQLAVKLFVRSGRNMFLTQSGEKLFVACQKGFDEIVSGLNSIQPEGLEGELTITSTQAFCSLWIMPRLYSFSQLHPEINVRVIGSSQIENLQKKHIDLAIRFSTMSGRFKHEALVVEEFGEDHVLPVCSPQLVEKLAINQPQDLLKSPLVSLANERLVTWTQWFKEAGVTGYEKHTMKTEVTSSDLALSAVLAGHGAVLAASTILTPYLKSGQLVVPFDIEHPVHWKRYFCYEKNSAKLEKINVFCNWIKEQIAQELNHFNSDN